MLFAVVAIDRPGRLDLRVKTRAKHLAFLAKQKRSVRVAGPFTAEDGTPVGSLLLIEAKTLAAAEKMIAGDPYVKAGVFESVTVRPWKQVTGTGLPEMTPA